MVVDIWTASAESATRIRKNNWGPWLEEGPKEDDKIGVVANIALVGPETDGNVKPPGSPESCFFGAAITLEGRRCILVSSCSF